VRPTRDETRQRIFIAAAGVFAELGVAGASIEQIAAAAGFTRGAFYSNFTSKDELAIAMLDDHLARSQVRNRALVREHPDAQGFVQALRDDHPDDDPLHHNPLLQVELMLYVARTPELRPLLGDHLRTMRSLVGEIATSILRSSRPTSTSTPRHWGPFSSPSKTACASTASSTPTPPRPTPSPTPSPSSNRSSCPDLPARDAAEATSSSPNPGEAQPRLPHRAARWGQA
jgi:AcrR family transcriptional regulator